MAKDSAENHDAREHGRAGQDRPGGHHAAQHQAPQEGQHCGLPRQLSRQILQSEHSNLQRNHKHFKNLLLQDVLDAGELAKLVFYNDIVVGGVCCRVDASPVGRKVCIYLSKCQRSFYINFPALHHDPGLPGALQTSWDRDKDVGARLESRSGGWQFCLNFPSCADQQPVSHRVLQKVRLQHCGNQGTVLQGEIAFFL